MIIHNHDSGVYYTCERCGEIFFHRPSCDSHERHCDGKLVDVAYSIYAYLGVDVPIVVGVTRHRNEKPVSLSEAKVNLEGSMKGFLIYNPPSHLKVSKITTSSVALNDLPELIAEVQQLFLNKLMELAKDIPRIEKVVTTIVTDIRKITDERTT